MIVAKSLSKPGPARRVGFVTKLDKQPGRRLKAMLSSQGMQANQQIIFLSDGADNVKDLQYLMYPEAEHLLDWFHLAMRFTVLGRCAKGVSVTDPDQGRELADLLENAKWYFWHGNTQEALEHLDEGYYLCYCEKLRYRKRRKLLNHLQELRSYIDANVSLIPNYDEKYRYGEAISTAFIELTVNEVVAKRMVKKQQMKRSHKGAHYRLQTRTAVLNGELRE